MSSFFSLRCSSDSAAVCRAESWRSVVKMLNSLSSWPKAAPVSEDAESSEELASALAFSDDHGLEDAEQAIAIVGEVLQDVDGGAVVAHDGEQIGGGHVSADELLGGAERAQLVGRRHGAHVEVEGEQTLVFVADLAGALGGDLGAARRL